VFLSALLPPAAFCRPEFAAALRLTFRPLFCAEPAPAIALPGWGCFPLLGAAFCRIRRAARQCLI